MTFEIGDINPVVANLQAREWVQYPQKFPWLTVCAHSEETSAGAVSAHGAVMTCKVISSGDHHIIRAVMRQQGLTEQWNDMEGRTKGEVLEKFSQIEVNDATLAETFGPQWEAVVELIRRAAVLTPGEAKRLKSRRAALAKARFAEMTAWRAQWERPQWVRVREPAGVRFSAAAAAEVAAVLSAGDAVSSAAQVAAHFGPDAAGDAAWALVHREFIGQSESGFTKKHYKVLTGPWATTIGRVHPDDRDRLGGK